MSASLDRNPTVRIIRLIEMKVDTKQTVSKNLDEVLFLRVLVARLGESHRRNWWNVDATDDSGGSLTLSRILDSGGGILHRFAATEGAIMAARLVEESLWMQTSGKVGVSLFHLSSAEEAALEARWRHFKLGHEDLHGPLAIAIDAETTDFEDLLQKEITGLKVSSESTALGKRVALGDDTLATVRNILAAISLDAAEYSLVYAE